ncbi:hypothetical protein Zmor_013859 [Zophobas morio]|uniref:Tyr recombinase domain-containing protein n=1 Tax=Zophobas morio TaxID=2755281 RepID=A0AA38IIE4_9CUCU|nr:hypothetical protein Zmor_013859 [Zophobas morio]
MCENVPEEIAKKGKELRSNLLPLKSKNAYEKVYVSFQDWKNKNRIKEVTEDVILAFLDMRAILKTKENIDIEKFGAVISYIKKLNVGYRGKKSNVLRREEIKTFLQEADDGEYLFEKVALIFGIAGACRKAELCAIRFDDIQDCAKYTGHSFRRSSATLLVNAGGDITSLKRHGGWESTKVAESYIQESFGERVKIAQKIFGDEKLAPNELVDNEIVMDKPTNLSYSEACGSSSSSSSTSKNTAQNVYFE